jgi:hypothetical protein
VRSRAFDLWPHETLPPGLESAEIAGTTALKLAYKVSSAGYVTVSTSFSTKPARMPAPVIADLRSRILNRLLPDGAKAVNGRS